MLAYVTGTTLVKGVQGKEVFYVGDVQEDGYVYFNDSISYRMPTPSVIREGANVSVSDVQIWYPIRNCWIRANYFTNLQIYGVDPKNIYAKLQELADRMVRLEQRMDALEQRMNRLEQRVSDLENRMTSVENRVSDLENRMTSVENRITVVEGDLRTLNANLGTFYRDIVLENGFNTLTEYLMDWRSKFDVIANYLGEFWDALNLYSYDSAQNTLYYSDLESWMGAVKQMLRVSYNREQANQDGLNSLSVTVQSHTTSISNLFAADAAMTNRINTNEQNIQANANTITSHGNRIAQLEITVSQHGNTLTNHESRISRVETAVDNSYTSSGGNTYDIYDAFDKIFNDSANLVTKIGGTNNRVNELGHKALGNSYQGTNGNGVTLLNVYNKLNTVIDSVNTLASGGQVIGTIPSLPSTSVFTGWTDIFPV